MAISLSRGKRTTLAKVDAFADGVAVKTVRLQYCRPLRIQKLRLLDRNLLTRRDCCA